MVLAPFLITFREGLEAALVIAIIIAYLVKIGRPDLKKYVWIGTVPSVALSIVLGYIVLVTYGSLEGATEQIFEGTAALFATVVLTTMIFWMAKNARNIKEHLQKKIDTFVSTSHLIGVAVLAFSVVFKEGVETVLFLTASYTLDAVGTLIGTVTGFLVVLLIAFLLLKGTVRLPLQKFFKYTGVLLIIFAAGLFGFGIHEMMEVGEGLGFDFGFWGEHTYDINPADKDHLLHEKGAIGSIFKALVGYDGNPENLRVAGYIIYWIIVGGIFIRLYKQISFRQVVRDKFQTKKR